MTALLARWTKDLRNFVLHVFLDAHFCFWSRLYLRRWRPKIIIITGSVGKTSLLYVLKEQFGSRALYSHRANTKVGISLHLLGIKAISAGSQRWRWPLIILVAPFKALMAKARDEKIYLVEYDAGSPYASWYFKWWLRPDICIWTTVSQSHLENFVRKAKRTGREAFDLIVSEFAAIAGSASERIFAPAGNERMRRALASTSTPVSWVKSELVDWQPGLDQTVFEFPKRRFVFSQPLPREFGLSLALFQTLAEHLELEIKTDWRSWEPPPGRGRWFAGYGGSFLLDSSYNAQLEAFLAMLEILQALPIPKERKWLVAADMLEQADFSPAAHRKIGERILELGVDRVFLVGQRMKKYAYPLLEGKLEKLVWAEKVDEGFVDLIKGAIKGGEVLLFKGSALLDVLVEALLADPADSRLLNQPGRLYKVLYKDKR